MNTGTPPTGGQQAGPGLGDHVAPHNNYGEDGIRPTRRVRKFLHSQKEEAEATLSAYSVRLGMQGLQAKIDKILERL